MDYRVFIFERLTDATVGIIVVPVEPGDDELTVLTEAVVEWCSANGLVYDEHDYDYDRPDGWD